MIESIPLFPQATGTAFEFAKIPAYGPEILQVKKDHIYGAIHALKQGIEWTSLMLSDHEYKYGRTNHRDKLIAEAMENSLAEMKQAVERLRGYPNP